jgi:DNA-binding GntR family transcriptional regulator
MATADTIQGIREQIMARLRAQLLSGEFRPGQALREEMLAELFGVSRMPIRQVLHQLVNEGLLIARRNRGVSVAPRPSDSIRELLLPMRVLVELYALRSCYEQLTEADFTAWNPLLDSIRIACEQRDYTAVVDRDFAFHRALIERSGMLDLLPVWTVLINATQPFYGHKTLSHDDLGYVYVVHAELLKVIRRKNWVEIEQAVTEHIWNGPFNDRARKLWRQQARRKR